MTDKSKGDDTTPLSTREATAASDARKAGPRTGVPQNHGPLTKPRPRVLSLKHLIQTSRDGTVDQVKASFWLWRRYGRHWEKPSPASFTKQVRPAGWRTGLASPGGAPERSPRPFENRSRPG